LFHIWEKLLRVDKQNKYWLRILSRLSVCGVMLFFAVAFPFFGVINSVLGAFTTTFGTFIIPPLAYNMFYNSEERIANQPEVKKAHNMRVYKAINWIIIILLFVFGFGCGGYSSMVTLIDKVHTFHLFDECYGC
jgi:auxin influx carrier (AUX1 LAX family)